MGGCTSRSVTSLLLAALAVVFSAIAGSGCKPGHAAPGGLPRPAAAIVGTDSAGGTFRLDEQRGKVVVLSFGFTSCPDVCPTTLAKAKGMMQKLGGRAKDVAFAFVSVDPERDSPERLGGYVGAFDPGFHGVYVERARLGPLLAAYDVVATKREMDSSRTADTAKFYSIDHTGGFQVIDKTGQLRLKIPPSASVDTLVESVEPLLGEEGTVSVLSSHARLPAAASVGAVYLRIQNAGDHADRLLSVASPDAKQAELHEVIDDDGVMRMVPRPEGLAVGPHSTLELAEGGKHVMLMGIAERAPSAPLTLALRFERAGTLEVKVPVLPIEAAGR